MEDFFADRPKHSVFDKIKLWWKFHGRHYHKDFVRGIKKLWYWFPIIWKDRDWDQHYIYEILKHKLKSQANYISKNDRHTRSQQDARNMRICMSLIKKCQEETYAMEYMDYTKDKHYFEPCEDKKDYYTWQSENVWEKYDDFFKKYPLIYKRVINGEGVFNRKGREDDKKIIAMNISKINQDRARKLLFKIIESEIEGWWD
jgi:hypothetical protein